MSQSWQSYNHRNCTSCHWVSANWAYPTVGDVWGKGSEDPPTYLWTVDNQQEWGTQYPALCKHRSPPGSTAWLVLNPWSNRLNSVGHTTKQKVMNMGKILERRWVTEGMGKRVCWGEQPEWIISMHVSSCQRTDIFQKWANNEWMNKYKTYIRLTAYHLWNTLFKCTKYW